MARSFTVLRGLGMYQLPLASFTRGSLQPLPCVAHVDSVCLETGLPDANTAPGTLSVHELVLR